jgi:type III secretion system low calcium response chaperone LcrH/SycD
MAAEALLKGLDRKQAGLAGKMLDELAKGEGLKGLHKLGARDMEAIYGMARSLYQNGRYDRARSAFQFLCLFDHMEPRWWVGLGATMQRLKDYQGAARAYAYAILLDDGNPTPHLHAGYCLMALGEYEEAQSVLEGAVVAAEGDPKHAQCKAQAQALLAVVQAKSKEAQA